MDVEDLRFRPIGRLIQRIVNTPEITDTTIHGSTKKPGDSTVTTSTDRTSGTKTGQNAGAIGFAAPQISHISEALRELPGRDVKGLLPSSVNSCLIAAWKTAESFGKDGDVREDVIKAFAGYVLSRVPPEANLQASRSIVTASLLSAGPRIALRELQWLRLVTRDHRDLSDDDVKLMLAAYRERCAIFPEDVIVAACRNPPLWEFWPSLARLIERMESITAPRRQIEGALAPRAVEAAKARIEAERRHRNDTLAAIAERNRRWEEAAAWRRENLGPYAGYISSLVARQARAPLDGWPFREKRDLFNADTAKRVYDETCNFRLLDDDDPRVQARLREMGVESSSDAAQTLKESLERTEEGND